MKTESGGSHNRFAIRGRLLLDGRLAMGVAIVEGDTITEVRTGDLDADLPRPVFDAAVVSPGLIDLQSNGAFGLEVGGDPEALRGLAARLPSTGVTTFLPTLVSSGAETYLATAAALAAARGAPGARMPGLHLEGPLLSPARPGAHDLKLIEEGEATLGRVLGELLAANAVRLVTLAPERAGALGLVGRLAKAGVTVALGHTDATFDQMTAGIDAGATLVTHLYNAMRGFSHREPGAVGAALIDNRVAVSLIADGVHAHPAALDLALRTKGPQRIALVTDALAAAGCPPGPSRVGAIEAFSDGHAVRLADGRLAGSALTLDRAVRLMVSRGGARLEDALTMASVTPARLLGLPRSGRLASGYDADLVLWDSSMQVEAVFIAGRRVEIQP
jgi:N-acetylglucosamine-6-phosphate deacetylase